jgi:flagellin-like hook-associated protein FlgL
MNLLIFSLNRLLEKQIKTQEEFIAVLGEQYKSLTDYSLKLVQQGQLSAVEDVDLVKSASDLVTLELALQATLNSTARILQPTLLDFLR